MTTQVTPDTKLQFEIVGSYRRGAKDSGDIDVIFTTTDPSQSAKQQEDLFKNIIGKLAGNGNIRHILAQGKTKCLTKLNF